MAAGWFSFPDCSGPVAVVVANSASVCAIENSTCVNALLVLAGDSAETPV